MNKLSFLALGIVAAAGGCSSGPGEAESTPRTGVTSSQMSAFNALQTLTGSSWTWLQHDVHNTPMHLSSSRDGARVLIERGDAVKTTLDLLTQHKALFKMYSPALELSSTKLDVDHLGMTHARFQQMTHGIPVGGAELMAHYDAAGRITAIDANYVADLQEIDVEPTIRAEDALARVKSHVLTQSIIHESALEADQGKLIVYAPGTVPPRLAYEFKVRALEAKVPAIWVTTIDAKTGAILHQYDNLQTVQGSGIGVLGDQKQLSVSQSTAGFVMTDVSTGVAIQTFTASQTQTTPGTQITSNSAASWDTGVAGAGAAVDAHFFAGVVGQYYQTHHTRKAIDGQGGAMVSTVHFSTAYDNAAWDGTEMLYGDGGQIFKPLSAAVDVVGHEFTHGVTQTSSNLAYDTQSGALNEAVSDILGVMIAHSLKPNPDPLANWRLGQAITLNGAPLRDMSNPGAVSDPQPGHMSQFVNTTQDNGGVHINSGIINNAAFLMTVGGTNPVSKTPVPFGIGWDKSEKLWYRANTTYFMATTNFGGAAQGVLQAAKDLGFTANETNIVDCSFKAVGVAQGTCGTIVNPQSTVPGTGSTGNGTGTGTGTGDPGADGTTDGSGDPSTTTKKRRMMLVTTSQGCSATSGTTSGTAGVGSLFAAVVAIALGRRRTRTRSGREAAR
jgi:thermolysin